MKYYIQSVKYPTHVLTLRTFDMVYICPHESKTQQIWNFDERNGLLFLDSQYNEKSQTPAKVLAISKDLSLCHSKYNNSPTQQWSYESKSGFIRLVGQKNMVVTASNEKLSMSFFGGTWERKTFMTHALDEDSNLNQRWYLIPHHTPMYRVPTTEQLQRHRIHRHDNRVFYIRNLMTGYYLDVWKQKTKDKTKIIVWSPNGGENQSFRFHGNSLVSDHSGKALEVDTSSGFLYINSYTGHQEQQFIYNQQDLTIRTLSNQCIAVHGSMYSKSTRVVVEPENPESKTNLNQKWELLYLPSFENVPNGSIPSKNNRCRQMRLQNQLLFWKSHTKSINSFQEDAGSTLASFLTSGLVPVARRSFLNRKEEGIHQEWISMHKDHFKHSKSDTNFSFLNEKQWYQMFCHVMADSIISNFDTTQFDYGINDKGDVISFDKEHAFVCFRLDNSGDEDIHGLNIQNNNIWKLKGNQFNINSAFVHNIVFNKMRINFKDPIIENFFQRCESIEYSDLWRMLDQYAKARFKYQAEEFIEFIWRRIKGFRKKIYSHFNYSPSMEQPVSEQFNAYPSKPLKSYPPTITGQVSKTYTDSGINVPLSNGSNPSYPSIAKNPSPNPFDEMEDESLPINPIQYYQMNDPIHCKNYIEAAIKGDIFTPVIVEEDLYSDEDSQ